MANKPLRPCRHAGCKTLVRGGYCDRHKPVSRRSTDSVKYRKWYSLDLWTKKLRPNQLLREPFCRECAKQNLREYATDVDHIVPFEGDWALFVDPDNHQSLCHSCHGRKTAQETRKKIQRKRQ